MSQEKSASGFTISDLATHPNDAKLQLRFALGLYEISDLNSLLSTVIDAILTVTGMERGYLMIGETGDFRFPVARNKQQEDLDIAQFQFSHTIVDQVMETRRIYYSRTAAGSDISDSAKILQLKTILCIPLVIYGPGLTHRSIGVIYADSRRILRRYSGEQLELFGVLAGHAAMAIENARLYQLATIDNLTEVPLRHHVLNELNIQWSSSVRRKRPLTVGMIDIDHFKNINDAYGHGYGDAVLRKIANALKTSVRLGDRIGRYGGEEFLIVLPETDRRGAERLSQRICTAVRRLTFDGLRDKVTVSIGLASFPEDEQHLAEALVKKADEALYRAKAAGRDRVCAYSPK